MSKKQKPDETPAEQEDRLRREARTAKKHRDPKNRSGFAPLQSICFPGKWYYPSDLVAMGLDNYDNYN